MQQLAVVLQVQDAKAGWSQFKSVDLNH